MNTTHEIIDSYVKALHERASQGGGLNYAMGFLYSTLTDLNLEDYELWRMKRDTNTLKDLIDQEKTRLAESKKNDNWVPACGGTEEPFVSRSGKRLQYVWQPSTGHHAYLDLDSDTILSEEAAQDALQLS